MEKLIELLTKIDEDYLVGLTNKGIVKRAFKDIEKETIACEYMGDEITVTIGDAAATIRTPVNESSCTCPSRTICKHIIMGILYLKENQKQSLESNSQADNTTQAAEESTPPMPQFSELLSFSVNRIKKSIGEKKLLDMINRIQSGYEPEISITSIVKVYFPEDQITVKLLEPFDLSTCSCRKKGLCTHKAEAILYYQKKEGVLSTENLEFTMEVFDKDSLKQMSSKIKGFIEEYMLTGLSRTSPSAVDSFSRMAVICHNAQLPNFERWFREISEEYDQYFRRLASFRKERLLGKIVHCFDMADRLRKEQSNEALLDIIGEFKTTYYNLPVMNLTGVGSRDFKSEAGYEGTVYYFLEVSKMEWYTYTKVMPTFYENESRRGSMAGQNAAAPWNLTCKIEELSQMEIRLLHCKVNKQHRISSSSETKGEILGKSKLLNYKLEKQIFTDFTRLLTERFIDNEKMDEIYRLVLLEPNKVSQSQFDTIEQVLTMELYDCSNCKILLSVTFSQKNKYLIRSIERISRRIVKNSMDLPLFFGTVYIDKGELKFFPIEYFEKKERLEESNG